jgi:hypothetical protein
MGRSDHTWRNQRIVENLGNTNESVQESRLIAPTTPPVQMTINGLVFRVTCVDGFDDLPKKDLQKVSVDLL